MFSCLACQTFSARIKLEGQNFFHAFTHPRCLRHNKNAFETVDTADAGIIFHFRETRVEGKLGEKRCEISRMAGKL